MDWTPETPWSAELEAAQRLAVLAEARTWLGTPYRHLGDRKGAGIDCAMILVRCWVDTHVLAPFDPRPYPPTWHLHQAEERYLKWMATLAVETTTPQPADLAIWKFGLCFSHSAILVNATEGIHAYAKDRMCSLVNLHQAELIKRPVKYFDVWGKRR